MKLKLIKLSQANHIARSIHCCRRKVINTVYINISAKLKSFQTNINPQKMEFIFSILKLCVILFTGPTKNWIAVEGSHNTAYSLPSAASLSPQNSTSEPNDQSNPQDNMKIASSAPRGPQTFEERNVFAIYVSYYIKIKLTLNGMGGELALKLPFILGHVDDGCCETDTSRLGRSECSKISDCMRSRTSNEIVEEDCGQDEMLSEVKETQNVIHDNCNENANQCGTIQLEKQLRFCHLNANENPNNIVNTTDDDADCDDENEDDNDVNNEGCHNIITAQIHTESQPNQQSTEQVTDC